MIIVYDQREQRPYTFEGERYEDVTAEAATLYTADYSLKGLEDKIGIERKTLDDLAGTLTPGVNDSNENVNGAEAWIISRLSSRPAWKMPASTITVRR